ncbi:MAG: PIG-L family deacetylase [Sciscionella sp.]
MEPSNAQRRLLAIHAHPDDESITTGGLLARCADGGVRTRLVTCTDGRYGPVNPDLGFTLRPDELAKVRRKELGTAAEMLGVAELDCLGFHDSGMMGSPNNQWPRAFWAQPLQTLVEQVVRIVRGFRPHVLVTYDPFGCTGHPDHIQAHRAALLAVEAATESHLFPGVGAPWTVSQVFYPVFPMSAMERFITEEVRAGRPHPYDGRPSAEINYVRPDAVVTHQIDISEVYERKRKALHAHRTQVGSHYPQLYRAALARREHEHFRLALSRPAEVGVDDIFTSATRGVM